MCATTQPCSITKSKSTKWYLMTVIIQLCFYIEQISRINSIYLMVYLEGNYILEISGTEIKNNSHLTIWSDFCLFPWRCLDWTLALFLISIPETYTYDFFWMPFVHLVPNIFWNCSFKSRRKFLSNDFLFVICTIWNFENNLIFQMARNPMQTAGCYAILTGVLKNPNCGLLELDLQVIKFWIFV